MPEPDDTAESALSRTLRPKSISPLKDVTAVADADEDITTSLERLTSGTDSSRRTASPHRPPNAARHLGSEREWRVSAVGRLEMSRPTSERIDAARTICEDLQLYSADTTMAVVKAIEDLSAEDASLESRNAAFTLLKAAAKHTGLDATDRLRLYHQITRPIDPSLSFMQVKALAELTSNGRNLEPLGHEFGRYCASRMSPQLEALTAARRATRESGGNRVTSHNLKRGFHGLLGLVREAISGDPSTFGDHNIQMVLDASLKLASDAQSKVDMVIIIKVLAATVATATLSDLSLHRVLEILCGVSGLPDASPDLKEAAQELLTSILRSSHALRAIDFMLGFLSLPAPGKRERLLCGTLDALVTCQLSSAIEINCAIEWRRLMDGIWNIHRMSSATYKSCLKAIDRIVSDVDYATVFLQEDWETIIYIILRCTGDFSYFPTSLKLSMPRQQHIPFRAERSNSRMPSADYQRSAFARISREDFDSVHALVKKLVVWQPFATQSNFRLMQILFQKCYDEGHEAAALDFIANCARLKHLNPMRNHEWYKSIVTLVELFFVTREQSRSIRRAIVALVNNLISYVDDQNILRCFTELTDQLLEAAIDLNLADPRLAFELAELAIVPLSSGTGLERLRTRIWPLLMVQDTFEQEGASDGQEATNNTAILLVGLFLKFINQSADRATMYYDLLVLVAQSSEVSINSRLIALRLLTRLRCDGTHRIMVVGNPDSLDLASALCRTETSLHVVDNRASDMISAHYPVLEQRKSYSMAKPPLWLYPGAPGLPFVPPDQPSSVLLQQTKNVDPSSTLKLSDLLEVALGILQNRTDWEIYSYVLVHIPSQLSNPTLFSNATPHIRLLRSVVTTQLLAGNFYEPPLYTGVKKGDVAHCLFHSLVILLGYSEHFSRNEQDEIVRTFLHGITAYERTSKLCIHGLAIACHEIPSSITRTLPGILQKMVKIITQSHLATDILEFLGGLARLPSIYVNLREEEYRTVFAICVRYLEHSREQRLKLQRLSKPTNVDPSNRLSGVSSNTQSDRSARNTDIQRDLPQYVFTLAHHVITIWFLSLKLFDRSRQAGWITKNLAWRDSEGKEMMEEQSQVTLDMMHRTAYSDLWETHEDEPFTAADGKIHQKSWLLGMSIITVETAGATGRTRLTKRQASGTTFAVYQQQTAPLPPHHVSYGSVQVAASDLQDSQVKILPNHVFLQLASTIAPMPTPMEPICLPDDEATRRAIRVFDSSATVDGYSIGVIYVGNGQSKEAEILANTKGSPAFEQFLQGLGTKVELKNATFQLKGRIDQNSDEDGKYTYAWCDRVAEIVYHCPTMMPTDLEHDPQCNEKKKHVGNDYVNIIFNESGLPYKFDTIRSQYNYVNIVVTPDSKLTPKDDVLSGYDYYDLESLESMNRYPEKQSYYTVQTVSHPSLPLISPAASYKLLPGTNLPGLVRQMALNACVFSNIWSNRDTGEYVSSWCSRLRDINRLRERLANASSSTSAKYPGTKPSKAYLTGDVFKGQVEMGGLAEEEGIVTSLDFSRWAGLNG